MKSKVFIFAFNIFICLEYVICIDKEITINIDPRREDCFFEAAKIGDVIELEYQVIDGGHGDLDITFHLVDPTGRILIADYKKSENNHRADAAVDGDYKFCFDNTFSSYNVKTVFFELIIEDDDDEGDGNVDIEGFSGEDVYEIKVQDIQDIVNTVRNHITKVRHFQELIKSTEARDRNLAEENFFKVNTFSAVQIFIMLVVGFIQVLMLKSLFDDTSRVHKIWKGLNSKR